MTDEKSKKDKGSAISYLGLSNKDIGDEAYKASKIEHLVKLDQDQSRNLQKKGHQSESQRSELTQTKLELADIYYDSEPNLALKYLSEAIDVNPENLDIIILCDSLITRLGIDELKQIKEIFIQGYNSAKEQKNKEFQGIFLNYTGETCFFLSEVEESISYYEQALKISRELKDREEEFGSLNGLGMAYSQLMINKSDPSIGEKVISCYEQALEITREIGDRREEGRSLANLGIIYSDLGKDEKALYWYQQAIPVLEETESPETESPMLEDVKDWIKELKSNMTDKESKKDKGDAISYLGLSNEDIGDEAYKPSDIEDLKSFDQEKSHDLQTQEDQLKLQKDELIKIKLTLAEIYHRSDPTLTLQYLSEAIIIDPENLETNNFYGLLLLHLNKPKQAKEIFIKAYDSAKKQKDKQYQEIFTRNIGMAYSALGNTKKAISQYKEAFELIREIGDRQEEVKILNNLGAAYFDLKDKKAIACYEQALEIHRELKDRDTEGESLGHLGSICFQLGKDEKGIQYCEQAIPILKKIKSPSLQNVKDWLNKFGNKENI